MNTNLPNAPPSEGASSAIPRKLARVRPSPNEGNPFIVRRAPREPCRPTEKTSSLTDINKSSGIKIQRLDGRWVVPSSSNAAAHQEIKATPFNNADWDSYRLVTTKASLMKGLRYHVIRMHPKRYEQVPDPMRPRETIGVPRKVNLLDPKEFGRPVKLHRRDPSAPLGGVKETKEALLLASQQVAVYDEREEARNQECAKKVADKAEIESKIAPYGGAWKKIPFAKKTEQVFHYDATNAKMRYEEALPWFIEDFDNTNTWQGQREQNMSNGAFVALVHGEDGKSLRMIPMEKWYKFREVNKFKLSLEEAVARKEKFDEQVPNWMKTKKTEKVKEEDEQLTAKEQVLYNKNMKLCPKNVITSKGAEDVKPDTEEIDYEDDRFDNDDAGQVYGLEDDEEQRKEIERRIKKEQLSANALNTHDEKLYDAEESKQKKIIMATKKHGKQTKKALRKREGNHIYNSDSDSDPYASLEESEDEDEIIRLAEKRKKEVEAKLKTGQDKKTAEAAKEAQKRAEAADKKLKAAEKRKETAAKKKIENTQRIGRLSTTLAALGRKQTTKPAAIPTIIPASTRETSRNNKRPAPDDTTDSSSSSEKGPILKKPRQTAKANDNTKTEPLNGTVANTPLTKPPAVKNMNKKRKSDEIQHAEMLESKKQRIMLDTCKNSPSQPPEIVTPISPTLKPSAAPRAPATASISDEELRVLLKSHPQGVTVKFITTEFKGRIVKTKEDIQKMVATIKRVGKPGPVKGTWILKD